MSVRHVKQTDKKTSEERAFWMVDFVVKLPDGRKARIREVPPPELQSRRGAEQWERDVWAAIKDGSRKLEKGGARGIVPTLAEFMPRFIDGYARANQHKPSGIRSKESIFETHLLPALGERRLDQISTEDVDALKAGMGLKSPKTVNNALHVLSRALRVAVKWKVIDAMPCEIDTLAVAKVEMEFYEAPIVERLLAAAGALGRREELVVLLGVDAGLRAGEIDGLEWSDIDIDREQLTINRNVWRDEVGPPKGNKSRVVPLSDRLLAALRAHRHLASKRVLCHEDGAAVPYRWLVTAMERIERRAGLEQTGRLHILRHTFGARLAMDGAPPKVIQELMGHTSLSTTMRYMHLAPSSKRSAVKRLGQGNSEAMQRAQVPQEGAET